VVSDAKVLKGAYADWVRTLAKQKDDEALRAGNPKIRLISIDGTTGKTGNTRSGFRPGSIAQAQTAVRVQYLGDDLADLANKLAPTLAKVIGETFPDSKTKRLMREWEWFVQRNVKKNGKATKSERVGKTVPHNVGIYDVLWYVPSGPAPAEYAWFANYLSKKRFGYKYNIVKKTIHEIGASGTVQKRKVSRLRRRLRGFAAETSRRMRGTKAPGTRITAVMIQKAATGPQSRSKWGVPAIRISFLRNLSTPVYQ
jgi:hypothetical protein